MEVSHKPRFSAQKTQKCAFLVKFSLDFVAHVSKMYLLCTPKSER